MKNATTLTSDLVIKYKNMLNTKSPEEIINESGWSVKFGKKRDDNILAKADIIENIITVFEDEKYAYIDYLLLHELFHILEGRMANLDLSGPLELADIFAYVLVGNGKQIPLEKMIKINEALNNG